jgi:hypothetical protein
MLVGGSGIDSEKGAEEPVHIMIVLSGLQEQVVRCASGGHVGVGPLKV